ncbi:hypothetical protein H4R20_003731 [Coemansia guatemalensis]|uniref:carnosine N-methyltransferase n=1 Tax=Coemansia guatemalensis TaxID=2761395 RepID=A0A9W8HVP6_9FUNG|nr:hypothetical protein H4R20_003731 [Coemansia guatemalensis]
MDSHTHPAAEKHEQHLHGSGESGAASTGAIPEAKSDSSHCGEDDCKAEARALTEVVAAFLFYKKYVLNGWIYRRLGHIDDLSERHREIVSSLGTIDKIKTAERLMRENYRFLLELVRSNGFGVMPGRASSLDDLKAWYKDFFEDRMHSPEPIVKEGYMDKVLSTLKQLVREWSVEGRDERDQTFGPAIDALEREFANVAGESRGGIRVLVPGAGLGRLAFDICCRGFSTQGNEFSYFMLLTSKFILNSSQSVNQHVIYPFVHQFSNVAATSDQMRAVQIPDVLPTSMPFAGTAEFSMAAGDFIEIYGSESEKEKWDAIVTCFFIDTAKNALEYLDVMWHAMKPGAVWINVGPLYWHFDNVEGESSVEFTREEFIELIKRTGFVLDEEQFEECVPLPYTSNSRSMLQYTYRCFRCVARKPK